LDGHLSSQGFNSAISSISSNLIKGALAVHKEVVPPLCRAILNNF